MKEERFKKHRGPEKFSYQPLNKEFSPDLPS